MGGCGEMRYRKMTADRSLFGKTDGSAQLAECAEALRKKFGDGSRSLMSRWSDPCRTGGLRAPFPCGRLLWAVICLTQRSWGATAGAASKLSIVVGSGAHYRSWGVTASTASSMAPPSFMLRSGDQPCIQQACGAELEDDSMPWGGSSSLWRLQLNQAAIPIKCKFTLRAGTALPTCSGQGRLALSFCGKWCKSESKAA